MSHVHSKRCIFQEPAVNVLQCIGTKRVPKDIDMLLQLACSSFRRRTSCIRGVFRMDEGLVEALPHANASLAISGACESLNDVELASPVRAVGCAATARFDGCLVILPAYQLHSRRVSHG